MVTKKQHRVYQILDAEEWMLGREVSKIYKENYGRFIAVYSVLNDLRRGGFIETRYHPSIDGRVGAYRRNKDVEGPKLSKTLVEKLGDIFRVDFT